MNNNNFDYDIIVLGGGPGGYFFSILASMNNYKTLLVEKNLLGGTCLNYGCIPTKAILKSAEIYNKFKHANDYGLSVENFSFDYDKIFQRKEKIVIDQRKSLESLLKSKKVETIIGKGKVISKNSVKIKTDEEEIIKTAKYLVIATGSTEIDHPFFKIDHEKVLNSKDALNLTKLPKSIAIIGGGVIGVEMATIFSSFDVEVTIIELEKSLISFEDSNTAKYLQMYLKKRKVNIITQKKVENIEVYNENVKLTLSDNKELFFDKVLVSTGRKIVSDNIFENIDIKIENRKIVINEFMQTNIENIYAIGDVTGKKMLAHTAYIQAEAVLKHLKNEPFLINYDNIPSAIFTNPEIGSVGLTEEKAKELQIEVLIGRFSYMAISKARAISQTDGMIKTIIKKDDLTVLGIHIIGESATEMLGLASLIVQNKLKADELEDKVFAHPTIVEEIKEAILAAIKKAIHVI
jgi:dihydrolipoamide dehydrogenase